MRARSLHPWSVSVAEAQRLQQRLCGLVTVGRFEGRIRAIAGADVAGSRFTSTIYAGVVVLDYETLEVIEYRSVRTQTDFPYIPGLLSFRETPALLQAMAGLETTPDVIVIDGQGLAHPRGLGIASHMGILLDVPTIGCAKSRLIGCYEEPPQTPGAHRPLYGKDGTPMGAVLRTKEQTKPLFVSVGHKLDLAQAVGILLHCGRGYRLPEPSRLADQYVGSVRRAYTPAP